MTTLYLVCPPGLTVEIIDAIGGADTPPPRLVPAWATDAALPPGEARVISLNTMASQWEGSPPAGSGSLQKAVDAWCSGIDAPLLGRFGSKVFAGGGDADCWDTAAYAFDYETQLWSRIKDRTEALTWNPGADPQFNAEYGEHGDGTPAVPHTYDAAVYLPPIAGGQDDGALLWPVRRYYYPQRRSNWSHQLDLGPTVGWRRRANPQVPVNLNAEAAADYDPKSGRVWVLSATRSGVWTSSIAYLEPATDTVGTVSLGRGGPYLVNGPGCLRFWRGVDGSGRGLVWFQAPTVGGAPTPRVIDLDNPTAGVFAPALSAPLPPMNEGAGLAWCEPLRSWFLKPAGPVALAGTIFKITPQADPLAPWQVATIALPAVTEVSNNGLWKKFDYAPALRALTWYCHANGAVYAYRPEGV